MMSSTSGVFEAGHYLRNLFSEDPDLGQILQSLSCFSLPTFSEDMHLWAYAFSAGL